MIKTFDFYFDFGSPYSFLAHKEIKKIETKYNLKIKYMPVLLGGLLKLAGIKANVDIPIKGKYMIKDCKLLAEKYNTEFKFNNYFPIITLNLMRCALLSEKKNFFNNFVDKIFDSIWKDDLNLNDNKTVEEVFKSLKINSKNFFLEAQDEKIKIELKKRTEDAYKMGIFGVPTFMINDKIFWGQDRLEFVINEAKKL